MAKKAKELSALAVSKLKAEGRYAVGGADGLHFRITGNSKAWVLRIKIGTKRSDIGLGPYPEVSLADARELAREHRRKVRTGIDPLAEKREARAALRVAKAKTKTFEECARAYVESQRAGWKNEKHAKQWSATLETYAYPVFGSLPVDTVDRGMVLDVLNPIWATKTETAKRLRGRIEGVLDWAKVSGYRDGENPARWRGHLDKLLAAPSKVRKVEHHAALPYAEIGAFMAELRKRDGVAPRALELAILTAARSGEVRGMTWAEIDLAGKVWTIPGDRMKAGKEHRVPLSDAALAVLKALPRVRGTEHVFAAPRGGALSDMSLTAVLKRMGRDGLTQHGFRSTFRDWAGETTAYPREVIEHALAHQLADKAEAAYQRGDLLAKRARLMADWAKFSGTVAKSGANVVAIQGAA
ncbi:tyrosine-type recombinase/integrase [Sphingomonas sp.]|jgi:integrase|uniref:tyrosine-type recombinase/integrase n=1 Tax=Sphingomonas sp. TaxID=28214 RepID=UPI002D800DB7|nr:integrase arm-type DNA-binding domain-containing protein [Sphingomonas sp.]HEU0044212.1 integrase arm-type DNA-binding domain-containing protein [Sphingomonas sp.]